VPGWPDQYEKLLRAHCRFLGDGSPVDPDTHLATLGMDSMEIVSLIVDLEDGFGFQLPEELLAPEVFATPGTLWDALRPHLDD
jgi:acyl carrier protein